MEALGIQLATSWTAVWGTQSQTKSHTDSNTHCFVIKPETIVSNRESQKSINLHYVALLKPKISPSVTVSQRILDECTVILEFQLVPEGLFTGQRSWKWPS